MFRCLYARNHAEIEHIEQPEREVIAQWVEECMERDGLAVELSEDIAKAILCEYGVGRVRRLIPGYFLLPDIQALMGEIHDPIE